jgi:uncharacterized protein YdeI (BOF family)
MKLFPIIAILLLCVAPAMAADKRVFRIDSLIATQKGGEVVLQVKGAVQTGGWSKPKLHLVHNDGRVMTVEFVATPPPPEMTVIEGLVPVAATAQFRGRATSVHVQADENEITSQILR